MKTNPKFNFRFPIFIVIAFMVLSFECNEQTMDKPGLSIGSNKGDKFIGIWKKNKYSQVTIKKNGKNYLVSTDNKTFPASLENDMLKVSIEIGFTWAAINEDNGKLVVYGDELEKVQQ